MPARQEPTSTSNQKKKQIVERVLHAFKEGNLRSSAGTPVRNRKQAIAIALSESGQTLPDQATPKRLKPKAK